MISIYNVHFVYRLNNEAENAIKSVAKSESENQYLQEELKYVYQFIIFKCNIYLIIQTDYCSYDRTIIMDKIIILKVILRKSAVHITQSS
jgi:hypothetical protein